MPPTQVVAADRRSRFPWAVAVVVAAQLKIPEGTLSSRLATAHQILAKRLARHGLAVSGGSLAALFAQNAVSASVPASVVSSTIKTATLVAAQGAVTGVISTKVAALTEGVIKAMFLSKLKLMAGMVLALAAVVAFGGGVYSYSRRVQARCLLWCVFLYINVVLVVEYLEVLHAEHAV